jgi:hypothetical protein
MDRTHAPDPTPWQYEPWQATHAAMTYDDDPPKPPTTTEDRIAIAAVWFVSGWFTGWLVGLFF